MFQAIGSEQALALTTYHVAIATATTPNPFCGGTLVIDLLSSDPSTNRLTIKQFAHDGHIDTTFVTGGPVAGNLVFASAGGDSTTIDDAFFVNRLTIPFDTLGTYVSYDLILTENAATQPLPMDQVAIYFMRGGETSPQQTADPLGANALFAITATGQSGGQVEAFSPAVLQSGTTISVGLEYLCSSGGGGGCPFLDTRAASGWYEENSVLGRSVTGTMSVDGYRLKYAPRSEGGRVRLRLRENEQEYTTLDGARLATVDHPPGVRAFVVGERVILGDRVAASRVTARGGVDITELVDGLGGDFFAGQPGDTLLVDMMGTSVQGAFGAQSVQDGGGEGGFEGDPKEMEAPQTRGRAARPMNAGDEAILDATGILVQRPDGQGGWRTVTKYYPREYRDEAVFDSLGDGGIRLIFVGRHRLHWIGRIARSATQATAEDLRLLAATHSRLGNVRAAVADLGGSTTVLTPGDTLNLEFAATAVPAGQVRDWFLFTKGMYSSTAQPASDKPEASRAVPARFALAQNRPNPFAELTTIHFDLPVGVRVRLEIFDAQGRLVRTLANGTFPAGFHAVEWDHRTDGGKALGAGVYLYRIQAGTFRDQKKMVLLAR